MHPDAYRDLVSRALAEDLGSGDITTRAIVPAATLARAVLIAKSSCVLAGLPVAEEVCRQVDARIVWTAQCAAAGADIIMLDNLAVATMREAVALIAGRARVEVSGGVSRDRIAALATIGADVVSSGASTHSAPAADISLAIEIT